MIEVEVNFRICSRSETAAVQTHLSATANGAPDLAGQAPVATEHFKRIGD
jgi:hypothetical protein